MDRFTKQPYESFIIAGDFKNVIESGELIVELTSEVIAYDKSGTVATAEVTESKAVSGKLLQTRVKDGTMDKSPYKITFRIITSLANKWELDVQMRVMEI